MVSDEHNEHNEHNEPNDLGYTKNNKPRKRKAGGGRKPLGIQKIQKRIPECYENIINALIHHLDESINIGSKHYSDSMNESGKFMMRSLSGNWQHVSFKVENFNPDEESSTITTSVNYPKIRKKSKI